MSPCCDAAIWLSRGDGVMIGSCGQCLSMVCRINPRSGVAEWLDGEDPWIEAILRPMEELSTADP